MAEPRRDTPVQVESVHGARFLIVEARFYTDIGTMLLDGVKAAFDTADARYDVISVSGALEIPAMVAIALDAARDMGQPYDGVVTLGCVIRGETYHFEIVAGESARALMDLSVARKLAFGNGILTVENEHQAIVRADPAQGDKGGDAARAALEVVRIKRRIGAY
jgi:6,7-dimethyl-8-ribityllumazine synthase